MPQLKVDWPFGKSWLGTSILRTPRRTRRPKALAAQIEFLEERTLLSVAHPINLGAAGNGVDVMGLDIP